MIKETNRFTANDPCTTPGCNWKYGFHICLDPAKYDMGTEASTVTKSHAKVGKRRVSGVRTQEQRDNMAAAVRDRAERKQGLHKKRDAKIVEDYEKNWMSILEIALEHSVGKDTIKRILEENGVSIRPRGVNKYTVYFRENVKAISIEHSEHGKSYSEIAKKYRVSEGTVKRAFKEAGVKTRMGRQKPAKYAFN